MKIQEPKGNSELLPEGVYPAVLVEMLDLGRPRGDYQGVDGPPKPCTKAVFQLEEINDFDERYELSTKTMSITWGKKSKWPPFIANTIGPDKLKKALENGEFDPDALVGANVLLTIFHDVKGEGPNAKTYLGISNISQPPKGMPPIFPDGYVMQRERKGYAAPIPGAFEDVMEDVISTAPTFLTFKGEGYQPFGQYAIGEPRIWRRDVPTLSLDYWTPQSQAALPITSPATTAPATKREPRQAETRPISPGAHDPKQYAKDLAAGREPQGVKVDRSPREPQPVLVGDGDDDDVDVFADE